MVNFLISIIANRLNIHIKMQVVYTNLLLGIFNLLPIIPLDGGNILISFLNYKFNVNDSIKMALIISKLELIILSIVYCIFILILKNLWIFVLIIYLWYLYLKEEEKFEFYLKIHERYKNIMEANKNKF